jgi:hypothetical protein
MISFASRIGSATFALFLSLAASAQEVRTTHAESKIYDEGGLRTALDTDISTTLPSVSSGTSLSAIPPNNLGGTSGSSSSTTGRLTAFATSSVTSITPFAGIDAQSLGWARWTDDVIIGAAGLAGETGFLHSTLAFTGSKSWTFDPGNDYYFRESTYSIDIRVAGTGMAGCALSLCNGANYRERDFNFYPPGSSVAGSLDVLIPFTFGSSLHLDYWLESSVRAAAGLRTVGGAPVSTEARADYSLSWAGISSIRDVAGNLVASYTVTSGSGFDYEHAYGFVPTAPIPEPETYALMLAGLGLLALASRRRKSETPAA